MNKPKLTASELLGLKNSSEEQIKILKLKAFFTQRELRWTNNQLKKMELPKDEEGKEE